MGLLSAYERKARLTPGLFAVGPVVVAIATLGLKRFPAVAGILSFLSAAGGTYLLAVVVARFGRNTEKQLNLAWGGRPTTQLLRTRGDATNETQREIWRQALTQVTEVRLLTPFEEATDPTRADQAIEAAVGQIRYLGHGDGVLIVAAENAQYGLERNLYGFRTVGAAISGVCAIALAVAIFFPHGVSRPAATAGLVVSLLFMIAWLVVPSAERAKDAGFRYANQLMHAVVNLARGSGRPAGETRDDFRKG